MEFAAHLPFMDFGGNVYTLDHLIRLSRYRAPREAIDVSASRQLRGCPARFGP